LVDHHQQIRFRRFGSHRLPYEQMQVGWVRDQFRGQ
jgi:hypothetical protein